MYFVTTTVILPYSNGNMESLSHAQGSLFAPVSGILHLLTVCDDRSIGLALPWTERGEAVCADQIVTTGYLLYVKGTVWKGMVRVI